MFKDNKEEPKYGQESQLYGPDLSQASDKYGPDLASSTDSDEVCANNCKVESPDRDIKCCCHVSVWHAPVAVLGCVSPARE